MGSGFRLHSQKLLKIKALAGTAVPASGPAHGMCLGQVPPHASLSSQEGPHLMLLISHWPGTIRACTGCCQGQSTLDLQEHLEVAGLLDSVLSAGATQVSQAKSSLQKLPWFPGSSACGISCLLSEVGSGYRPGNC